MNARAFLIRGLLAGLLAGFAAFAVAYVVGEPHVDSAIAIEESAQRPPTTTATRPVLPRRTPTTKTSRW